MLAQVDSIQISCKIAIGKASSSNYMIQPNPSG